MENESNNLTKIAIMVIFCSVWRGGEGRERGDTFMWKRSYRPPLLLWTHKLQMCVKPFITKFLQFTAKRATLRAYIKDIMFWMVFFLGHSETSNTFLSKKAVSLMLVKMGEEFWVFSRLFYRNISSKSLFWSLTLSQG